MKGSYLVYKFFAIFIVTILWNTSTLGAVAVDTPVAQFCQYTSLTDCQENLPAGMECCLTRIITEKESYNCNLQTDFFLNLNNKCVRTLTDTQTETVVNDAGTGYTIKTTKKTAVTTCDAVYSSSPSTKCYTRQEKTSDSMTKCLTADFEETIK